MKRKIFFMCALMALGVGQASAQDEQGIFNHLGASVGVGTPGISIDVATCVTPYVGLRAGIDIMPSFKYKTDIKIDGVAQRQAEYDQVRTNYPQLNLPNVTFPNKVDVEGKLKNTTGHFLIDVYPGKKIDWHLTVGAYFGPSDIINVYTTDDSQLLGVSTYNNSQARVDNGFQKIGAELGDFFLEPDANGHIDANIKVKGFRPYVGLGWGRAVPKNHRLGFQVDLGVQFWGTPKVYCQGKELTKEDVDGEDGGFMKTLTKITVYPVLSFRLTGKIF